MSCIATFVTFNNLFEIIKSNIKNSTQLPKTLKIITDKKISKGGLGGNQYIYLFYGACFWAVLSFNIGNEKPCSTAFGSFFYMNGCNIVLWRHIIHFLFTLTILIFSVPRSVSMSLCTCLYWRTSVLYRTNRYVITCTKSWFIHTCIKHMTQLYTPLNDGLRQRYICTCIVALRAIRPLSDAIS